MREALEGMAARQAAQNATDEDIAGLHRSYTRHVAAAQKDMNGPVWPVDDEDFHVLIARASRNPMLIQMLTEDFYQLIRFYKTHLAHVLGRESKTVSEHRRVMEAIEDRDGDLAELLMRRHVASARKQWCAALRQQEQSVL